MAKKGLGSGLDALFGSGAELKEDAGMLNLPIIKAQNLCSRNSQQNR